MNKNKEYININGCLTQEGILYLLQKKKDTELSIKLEKHLKECELCRNAFSGYKKINNPKEIENANRNLEKQFSSSHKRKKNIILPSRFIINITAVAAAIVLGIFIAKNLSNIIIDKENIIYPHDLALLSKEEIKRPSPPEGPPKQNVIPIDEPIKMEQTTNEIKEPEFEISKRPNIAINNFPSASINNNLNSSSNKKLVDKSYTEFQITLPVEVDRRGYSYHNNNNIITASYEKGVALSALPSFKGKGLEGFVEYVSDKIKYPKEAQNGQISGTVEIQFAIDVDGVVKEIEVKKGINPILDREAYRLIQNSPKWIPGFVNGKPTKVYLRFPVKFTID